LQYFFGIGGVVYKLVLLALIAMPLSVQAQVYRWVDETGKVHYGDRPIAKEVKPVAVLREAKALETVPRPGMKADEVRKAYGEPERVQKVSTKSGETLIWTYRKSKQVARDFVVKIEGGEVAEVSTDSGLESSRAVATVPPNVADAQARARAAGGDDFQRQQELAQRESAEKEQRCASLRENVQRIESEERRGGSATTMDRLHEQKRQYTDKMWSQGCGS
jgi:hypothetical protein